jgi:eukaryotic-like serine/threonine-protein kinase
MGIPPAADGGVLPSGVRPLRADDPAELGGNTLVGRLGSGGMGVVYLARDPLTDLVAVKSAHAEAADEELARRFAAEVACLRRVPDACTARLIADGSRRTPPYIVTEYVEGRSLEHLVETGGPLPPEQVRALATGVGRALAAIHEAGLVHRDLKPANILLTPAGPRVIDFGIAHEVGASGGLTIPGMVVGSPGWIPPERLNRRPATPASDVFGWGCLVAYAGTGRNPFGEGDLETLAGRVLTAPPDLDGLAEPVRGLVEQALAKDPAVRPSAAELLERLVSGAESGVGGPGVSRAEADPGGGAVSGGGAVFGGGAVSGDGVVPSGAVSGGGDVLSGGAVSGGEAVSGDGVVPSGAVSGGRAVSGGGAVRSGGLVSGGGADFGGDGVLGGADLPGGTERRAAVPAAKDAAGPRHTRGATGRRRGRLAVVGLAVVAAAALVALIATTAADHDTARTPPSGERSAPPPSAARSTPAPAGSRTPVTRERSGRPRPTPRASAGRPVPRPSSSSGPIVSVPGLIDSALPDVRKRKGVGVGGR